MKLSQILRPNKKRGLDGLQQGEYRNCLENCMQKTVLSVPLPKCIDVLNELQWDSVMDLVQFNIFIKDLDEIESMIIWFADETKVRQKLH